MGQCVCVCVCVCVCEGVLTVVESDHVEGVEQLPLVLVDALDVAVKHGVRLHCDPSVLQQVLYQLRLVVLWGG